MKIQTNMKNPETKTSIDSCEKQVNCIASLNINAIGEYIRQILMDKLLSVKLPSFYKGNEDFVKYYNNIMGIILGCDVSDGGKTMLEAVFKAISTDLDKFIHGYPEIHGILIYSQNILKTFFVIPF